MRDQGGLSFPEALAVLVLLGVLAAAALPHLFPAAVAADAAARELVADLNLARQLAASRQRPHVVEFSPRGGPFTAYTVRPQGGQPEPGFPKQLPVGTWARGPESVTFLPSGAAQLTSAWADWELATGQDSVTVRIWAQTGYARVVR